MLIALPHAHIGHTHRAYMYLVSGRGLFGGSFLSPPVLLEVVHELHRKRGAESAEARHGL